MELVNTISRSQSLAMGMNTYCRLSMSKPRTTMFMSRMNAGPDDICSRGGRRERMMLES